MRTKIKFVLMTFSINCRYRNLIEMCTIVLEKDANNWIDRYYLHIFLLQINFMHFMQRV
jgi:hypothetical protein